MQSLRYVADATSAKGVKTRHRRQGRFFCPLKQLALRLTIPRPSGLKNTPVSQGWMKWQALPLMSA